MNFKREDLSKEKYAQILFKLQQKWKNNNNLYLKYESSKRIEIKKENSQSISFDKKIKDEQWFDYKDNSIFKVSNLGRVKFNGLLVPQKEDIFLKLDKKAFKNLYPNESVKFFEEYKVHEMVAKTFLNKIVGDNMEIHHINDNEYDNSADNLVLLTNIEHSLVHSKKVPTFPKKYK